MKHQQSHDIGSYNSPFRRQHINPYFIKMKAGLRVLFVLASNKLIPRCQSAGAHHRQVRFHLSFGDSVRVD